MNGTLAYCSQRHEAPPEGVKEGPGVARDVLFRKVDQTGERENRDEDEEEEQPQLLVGLLQGVE